MNKCRICLDETLFSSIFNKRGTFIINKKIMSLAKVEVYPNDGLPDKICSICIQKLDNCIEFIKQCQSSDKKLRTLADNKTSNDNLVIDEHNYFENDFDISLNDMKHEKMETYTLDKDVDDCNIKKDDNDSQELCIDIKDDKRKNIHKQQCFTCGKVMSSSFRLKTHLRTHTGERPFSCTYCKKKFTLPENLKVHLRVHTGEKPLRCLDCGAMFAHTAGLAVHRRKHDGQTPYRCMLCPRSFHTIGHLQYHVRRHTGEKNFECDICSRAFITRSGLKQHIRTHSGDKPHVCCMCGLRLTRSSHLKRHIKSIHNGNKPFECMECKAKFTHKAEFEKHKKLHVESNVKEKS